MANGDLDALVSQRFGRLVVVADSGLRTRGNNRLWYCRCDCGQLTTVSRGNLTGGKTRSCGCLRRERLAARNRARIAHGIQAPVPPERAAWEALVQRPEPVHPTWRQEYLAFARDVGPRPSARHQLVCADPAQGYVPGNVRWQAPASRGRRSARTPLAVGPVTRPIADWAAMAGVPASIVLARLRRGLEARLAVAAPSEPQHVAELVGGALTFEGGVRAIGNGGRCVSVPAAVVRGLRQAGWARKLVEVSIDRCAPFHARVTGGTRGAHRLYLPRDATARLRLGQRVVVALRA